MSLRKGNKIIAGSSEIIESGSNSNGDYIKYSDGHMECYKTITVTGINITNKWGSLYENGSEILLGNFAQTFKKKTYGKSYQIRRTRLLGTSA